jgi:hypothetical protein
VRQAQIDFFAEMRVFSDSIAVFARHKDNNGRVFIAQSVSFAEQDEGVVSSPMMEMRPCEVQQLMDELWRIGFRPTEGTGSAGSLAATERHLADMRKLAFHALKVSA